MTPLPIPNLYAIPVPGDSFDFITEYEDKYTMLYYKLLSKPDNNLFSDEKIYEDFHCGPVLLETSRSKGIPVVNIIGTVTASTMDFDAGAYVAYNCLACGGDGKETCDNPDHGLISAMTVPKDSHGSHMHDVGRLGCPACGHHPQFKVFSRHPVTNERWQAPCSECLGTGKMSYTECQKYMDDSPRVDEYIETPAEVIQSALAAAQIYFQNPLGEEPEYPLLEGTRSADIQARNEMQERHDAWQAAEKSVVQKCVIIKAN